MMGTKKTIAWEKWKNPYRLLKSSDLDDGYDKDGNIGIDEDGEEKNTGSSGNIVMYTPLGPVPLNDSNDPEKVFNFWVGHTNFNISKPIKKIIKKIEGVEILNIQTRYRLRIGVGKLFQAETVIVDINRKISEYFREKDDKPKQQESNTGINIDVAR